MRSLLRLLVVGFGLICLYGCDSSGVAGPTAPADPFNAESQPYGDPSLDPYRPYNPKPLLDIPAEPKPSEQKKK